MNRYEGIRENLVSYVLDEIVPRYAEFDPAHKQDHAMTVIDQSMKLLDEMKSWLDTQNGESAAQWSEMPQREMLFAAAAFHDLGLINGRDRHHLDSGEIIRSDIRLKEWFSPQQIETIAQAAEDHRASGKSAPRSIYGKIVAEADRIIDGETIIRRTVQFGFTHYPDLGRDGHIARAVDHLREKNGRGGYLKLWSPWSDNAQRLSALQDIIADDEAVLEVVTRTLDGLS